MFLAFDTFATWLRARATTDRGAALVEYALLVALIAVVCVGTVVLLGTHIASRLSQTGSSLN
jgi:pilus assembly protein Flp/PilA